ncbi:MAG: sterol-binding protein [Methylococcaceae bacterium]|nr:sterol-binding protein [Methylococcaceae bacterium]
MMPAALPLASLFTGLVEQALERFLALSPNHRELLAPLAGKHIALKLRHPAMNLHLVPTDRSIQFHIDLDAPMDVSLTGTWLAFARMGLSGSPQASLFGGAVRIDGDMKAARQFQKLFERLEIDWEGLLARQVGIGAAAGIVGWVEAGRQWSNDALTGLRQDCAEYLQEETRTLPAATEVDRLCHDVDTLRADADRLEARIERLRRNLNPGP